ncbi:MAG: ATP phosphoribosyltransferase [Dehalococcoidales bacterium]|nr:ATP phosphoribosyltransferase [Dehalococcoidales bacterium]
MLRLVLPKGSLEHNTLQLFEEADLPVRRGGDRNYDARIDDPRVANVKILRPQEIPVYVARGYFDLGVTGLDWIEETGSDVVSVMDLGYNKLSIGRPVKIVLAVPEEAGIAAAAQLKPGARVATEYPQLTRRYFEQLGIPVEVLPSYGATESKVPEIADCIVDVTETGASLRANRMRIIDVLLESRTKLIANKDAYADLTKRQEMQEISTLLAGVLTARGKVMIKLNVSEENLQGVISVLPAMKTPTVSRLYGSGYYAVETVAVKAEINVLIPELKRRGAEDILELPISKIVP